MTLDEMRGVIADIRYKPGYALILEPVCPDCEEWRGQCCLQVSASIPFPEPLRGRRIMKGGKYLLSPHMTQSELVQKAFLAFLQFEEHEAREHFTYKGQLVLGPHHDLEQLANLMEQSMLKEQVRS